MKDRKEILDLANRCLNCRKPMCKTGCPIGTNIPEFINNIKENNYLEAFNILQENNILSEICSNVCPTEEQCMGKCIRGIKENPVSINLLERFINEWAEENNIKKEFKINKNNGKKIAIVGAGPAGISCAVELRKLGFEVTIFEKEEKIGGLLEYGIPDFRLAKNKVRKVETLLKNMGIRIQLNKAIGKDFSIENLKKDGYEAIFLAIGANIASTYNLADGCKDIYKSDEILRNYYNGNKLFQYKNMVIIGGGNVAIDSARTAKRMGAENVTIVYRRTKELMPAIKSEIEDAENDGISFVFNTKVIKGYCDDSNKLKEIECVKTRIEENKVLDIENSNFKIKADSVVFAIGLKIEEKLFNNLCIEIENGLIKVDENNMTSKPGIFAGGDLTDKKSTVCRAIYEGKKGAIGIEKYIKKSG